MFDIEMEEQEAYWNLWREERKIEKDIIDYKLDLLAQNIREGFSSREIRRAMREEIREKRKIRNK